MLTPNLGLHDSTDRILMRKLDSLRRNTPPEGIALAAMFEALSRLVLGQLPRTSFDLKCMLIA